jgi:hypothetical protein
MERVALMQLFHSLLINIYEAKGTKMTSFTVDIKQNPEPTQPKFVFESKQFPNFNYSSNVLIQCSDNDQRLDVISSIVADIIFDYAPSKENLIIMDFTISGEMEIFKDAATIIKGEAECLGMLERLKVLPNNERQFVIIHELDSFCLFQPGGKVTGRIRSVKNCLPNTHIVASMSSNDTDLVSEELQSYFPTKISIFELPRSEDTSI